MVNVMVLPPGSAPIKLEKIDADDYRELNRLVGGNLGSCSLPGALRAQNFYAFCDDDARVRYDPPPQNRFAVHLGHAYLLGPVVLVRTDEEGETLGLRRADVAALEMYLEQEPSAEALRGAKAEADWNRVHPSGVAVWTPEGWQSL
jgi:hypothetical protein